MPEIHEKIETQQRHRRYKKNQVETLELKKQNKQTNKIPQGVEIREKIPQPEWRCSIAEWKGERKDSVNLKMEQKLPHLNKWRGTSLVAQWLRIRLPMQGTQVLALVWEDATCRGATKPVCNNY